MFETIAPCIFAVLEYDVYTSACESIHLTHLSPLERSSPPIIGLAIPMNSAVISTVMHILFSYGLFTKTETCLKRNARRFYMELMAHY